MQWLRSFMHWLADVLEPTPSDNPARHFQAIIDSLEGDHASWDCDNYHATHKPSGVRIWVANQDYGLSVDGLKPDHDTRVKIWNAWLNARARQIADKVAGVA